MAVILDRDQGLLLDDDEQIGLAIQNHAWGYAVKDEGFAEVREAIKDVMAGKLHYAQEVLDRIHTADGRLRPGRPSLPGRHCCWP